MSFEDVKLVNAHFDQQPRKSKETMIGQIVRQVGQDLHNLVSDKGPFSLTQWNKLVTDGGGSPRKSFVDVAEEFEVNLDPVFDDFDGDIPIVELRDNKSDLRLLARKLGIDQKEIAERVKSVHGSMLLVNFVEGVRKFQSAQSLQSTSVLHSMCVASTMKIGRAHV